MKQRGFLIPSPTMILAGALALALLATFIQTLRLDAEQNAFELFQVQTKAVGDAQEGKTRDTERIYKQIVKEKDHENLIAHANLAIVSKRLRDRDSRRGLVPPATPGSSRPDLACSDRAELDRALSDFAGEAREIAIEGTAATINLNTGKEWVKSLQGVN